MEKQNFAGKASLPISPCPENSWLLQNNLSFCKETAGCGESAMNSFLCLKEPSLVSSKIILKFLASVKIELPIAGASEQHSKGCEDSSHSSHTEHQTHSSWLTARWMPFLLGVCRCSFLQNVLRLIRKDLG